jgi:hypothetical protein
MGAHLANKVLAHWTHVSDRAFRVLIRMALTALDKPKDDKPASIYFGGRELLAMTLRTDKGSDRSRYRVVARVLAELVEAGAVERADSGRQGHNAVYRLTLSRGRAARKRPAEGTPQGGQSDHPQDGQFSHLEGGQSDPPRVADLATPRNQEEPLEELLKEKRGDLQTASHPPREPEEPPEPEIARVVELRPGITQEAPYVRPPRPQSFAQQNLAAAAARRRAAVAAYRAQQEAK